MRVSLWRLVMGVVLATVIAGCGSSESTTQQSSSGAKGTAAAEDQAANTTHTVLKGTAPAEDQAANTKNTVLKSGFGGDNQYVWVAALVRNDSNKSGATVVANFNLLDAGGQIIKSESQTESFSYPGQELAIGTQASLLEGSPKPAKVDVTVNVEYPGIGTREPLQPLKFDPAQITEAQYGSSYRVSANVTNPTDQAIKSARVGVLCYNANGDIIGGTSIYPDLIPPKGQIKVESSILSSGKPASCDMRAPTESM